MNDAFPEAPVDPEGPAPLQPEVVAPLPGNPKARNLTGSGIALLWLVLIMLNTTGAVSWTSDQQVAVFTLGSIVLALLGAIYANQLKGTKREPVAIAQLATLAVPPALAIVVSFHWVHWTAATSLSVGAVATAAVGFIALAFGRANATADLKPIN